MECHVGYVIWWCIAITEGLTKPDAGSYLITVDSVKVGCGLRIYISGNSSRFLWS